MARLRLRYTTWPRPLIHLTDTPNPKCFDCDGIGSWTGRPSTKAPSTSTAAAGTPAALAA